jgi:aquaporin Z
MTRAHVDRTKTTAEQRMLRSASIPDFLDSSHEWRRLFAESWGTFLLVLVAAGAGVVSVQSRGAVTLSMKVIAPGLMVMAIIYFMGAVGGAHLNPSVTLAFAVRRNFPWRRVPSWRTVRRRCCGRGSLACHVRHDRVDRRNDAGSGRE